MTQVDVPLRSSDGRIRFEPPNRRDPRFKVAAVITSLHVLGQTVLDFKVSIAQILVSIGICGAIDAAVTFRQRGVIAWPASGVLAGNSIAFILRASGTQHGDWWTLHGIGFFVVASLVASLSKHIVRPNGHHVFNPSNIGIVLALLMFGPARVFPQYLWWGPVSPGTVLAWLIIGLGAIWVLRAVRMTAMALSFLVPFGALVAIFALMGRSFFATWSTVPMMGASYWLNLVLSPETLVFVFFMMTDPQTAPKGRFERMIYGSCTALVAAVLLYFQPTEYGVKLAILASLTIVCAIVPFISRAAREAPLPDDRQRVTRGTGRRPRLQLGFAAVFVIAATAMVTTAAFSGNRQVMEIERGATRVDVQ